MSRTVDERIVSMQFDNKKFEDGVQTTMDTISKLKSSLDFSGAEKGLGEVTTAAKGVDMAGLAAGVVTVTQKFSWLEEMAIGALRRIGEQITDKLEQQLKGLTIDQVTAGWSKFGEKTRSVQTIMAATAKDFEDEGEQMEFVNEQLDKLNWFTDETSYNFVDMVNNIGKFTSNGVKLDDAVTAMQGISTWAARSGANAGEASRAMYNLSQAISVGAVKLQDWKSIENANMATYEFKETAIQAAVEAGMLAKVGDGLYKTMQGNTVSVTNFNQALSDGWFTSEVLLKSLDQYGGFTNKLNAAYIALGDGVEYTTSDILDMIDEFNKGELDIDEVVKNTGLSAEELNSIFEELGDSEYELGRQSFRAAQAALTFEDAINATKDAVSTGWMKSFEIIFGDFTEAKDLWTKLANELYDVFAESGNARNEMLKGWAELGGRDALIKSVSNTWKALKQVLETVKEAFREVFPPMTSERLYELTERLRDFTENFKMSDEELETFKSILVGVFSLLKSVFSVIGGFASIIFKAFNGLTNFVIRFVTALKSGTDALTFLVEMVRNLETKVEELLTKFGLIWQDTDENGLKSAKKFNLEIVESNIIFSKFKQILTEVASTLKDTAIAAKDFAASLKDGIDLEKLKGVTSILSPILDFLKKIGTAAAKLSNTLVEKIFNALSNMKMKDFFTLLQGGVIISILLKLNKAAKKTSSIIGSVSGTLSSFRSIFGNVSRTFKSASLALDSVRGALRAYQFELSAKALISIATAIAILVGSIVVLSMVDTEKLGPAVAAMTGMFVDLMAAMAVLSKTGSKLTSAAGLMITMIGVSAALLLMAVALKAISKINPDELTNGIFGLNAVLISMVASAALLGAIGRYSKRMIRGTTALVILGAATLVMVGVCKKMKDVEYDSIGKAIVLMGGMLAAAAVLGAIGRYAKKMITSSTALVIMGAAMSIAASVCLKMREIAPDDIEKAGKLAIGMVGVAAAMALIGRYSKKMINSSLAMVILGASMHILVGVCDKMKNIEWESMTKAVLLMVSVVAVAGYLALVGSIAKKMNRSAIALTILAAAMEIMANVCDKMQYIDTSAIAKVALVMSELVTGLAVLSLVGYFSKKLYSSIVALTMFTGVIAIMVAICDKMQYIDGVAVGMIGAIILELISALMGLSIVGNFTKKILKALVVLAILTKVLDVLVDVCKKMNDVEWSALAKAGAAMTGLTVFALFLSTLSMFAGKMMLSSTALLTVGLAFSVFVPIIQKLGDMDLGKIGKALLIVAGAFIAFSLAGQLLTPAIPSLLGAAGAMALFGVSALAIGSALSLAAAGIASLGVTLSTTSTAVTASLSVILTELVGLVEYIVDAIEEFIIELCDAVVEMVPPIKDAILEISMAILELVEELLPKILKILKDNLPGLFEVIGMLFDELFAFLEIQTPKLFNVIKILVGNVMSLIEENMPRAFAIIQNVITNVFSLVQTNLPKIFEIISSVIDGVIKLIVDKAPAIANAGLDIIQSLLNAIDSHIEDITKTAISIVVNFINGISQKLPDIIQAGFDLIINFINGIADAIDNNIDAVIEAGNKLFDSLISAGIKLITNSITRVKQAGSDFIHSGFVEGIKDKFEEVKTKMGELVTNAIQKIKDKFSEIKETAKTFITNMKDGIDSKITEIKNKMSELITGAVQKIKDRYMEIKGVAGVWIDNMKAGITDKVESIKTAVGNLVRDAIQKVKDKIGDMSEAGGFLIDGLRDGITGALKSITDAVKGVAGSVVTAFKDFFHIASPSRLMMELGGYISEGAAIGIEDKGKMVTDATEEMAENAVDGAKSALSAMSNVLNNDRVITPTISPVVDSRSLSAAKLDLNGTITSSVSQPINAMSQVVANAQSEINASNNRVISAIAGLRAEMAEYYSKADPEIALYVDSTKMASSLVGPMNRQLNILSRREAY